MKVKNLIALWCWLKSCSISQIHRSCLNTSLNFYSVSVWNLLSSSWKYATYFLMIIIAFYSWLDLFQMLWCVNLSPEIRNSQFAISNPPLLFICEPSWWWWSWSNQGHVLTLIAIKYPSVSLLSDESRPKT